MTLRYGPEFLVRPKLAESGPVTAESFHIDTHDKEEHNE
jgi:hypothetical protein